MDELKAQIKQMIVERLFLDVSPSEISDSAPLMETYGIDSVALFELVVGLEEEFDIELDDTDFSVDAFHDVNAIARLVEQSKTD
jgi:acyl carrier protein